MIDADDKYYSLSGDIPVGGPSTWHVTDWDQRSTISVTMDGEQDDESLAIEHFRRLDSQIPIKVYRVYVSGTGELVSKYTDANDGRTYCVHYPSIDDSCLPEGIQTIRRDKLEELERFGPDADLVGYPPCFAGAKKYAERCWNEMQLWMRLPSHPNIVAFDRVVVDELQGRIVGFTNEYVPGGTVEENRSRGLCQLIQAVDDLNLRYGIVHQDNAPRNLLVDEDADNIMLFDFNYAARVKVPSLKPEKDYQKDRNDVKGVMFTMYEIITGDDNLRSVPHEEQSLEGLQLEWKKHPDVRLDSAINGKRVSACSFWWLA